MRIKIFKKSTKLIESKKCNDLPKKKKNQCQGSLKLGLF